MSSSLLATKLFIPAHRPGTVARAQLLEHLTAGKGSKLILVSAPAGYGKTTLLAEWISQMDFPVSWVSLDAQDNDLKKFISYLIASLKKIDILINEAALARLDQPTEHISEFISPLIHQISTSFDPIYIVFDDYHRIDNPEIHQALTYLLGNLPPNLHLVIATRSDPPFRLAKMRAQGELCEIRADDLRFSTQEAVQYFNQRMGLGLSQPDIDALTKKTEGWIVGLQLASISLQKHPDKHQFVRSFAGDDRYIADYLFDEAFNRQPDHIQTFLLQTSILDQFNAPLCDTVSGQENSQSTLLELESANLFLVALDSQRNWYRYHHLFRDLLHHRLQYTKADKTRELHSRASQWYAREGFLNQAATHAIKAKDTQQLERLIQENMLFLLETGESRLFEDQLTSFYASFNEPNYWVCIARAWSSVFSGQVESTEEALQEAEAIISKPGTKKSNKALGNISTIRGYVASLTGKASDVKTYAKEALALLPEDDHATIAYAAMMLASAYLRLGENNQAETACLEAIRACDSIPDSYIRIDALCMLSQLRHVQGELQKTVDTLEEALAIADRRQILGYRHLPIIGFAKIRKSTILYEWNKLDQAEDTLNQGIALIEKWGEKDSYLVGIIQSVIFFKAKRNPDHAIELIKQGKTEAKGLTYWYTAFDVLGTWISARSGDFKQVDQWLKEQDHLFNQQPTNEEEFIYRFLIEILILRGDFTRANRIIKSLLPVIEGSDSIDRLIRILILKTRVSTGLGDKENALSSLTRALELAQPRGYLRTFIDGGEEIAQLLYQCVQRGIHKQYCSTLLEAFTTDTPTPGPAGSSDEFLVEPLSPRETDVLQLIARGLSNQEIGQELIVSIYTVKSHARNIFGKLGVKNRTEAVAKARIFGLLAEE